MSERVRYWQQQVAALESSRLSRAEFCRRRQLNYHTMTYWLKRLKQTSDQPPSFVEVSLSTAVASSTYEVVLGNGRSIRLGTAFDEETVGRLVRTLESC